MALFRAVSEIFNVEKCRDLEIGIIESGTIRDCRYSTCKYNYSDLENRG